MGLKRTIAAAILAVTTAVTPFAENSNVSLRDQVLKYLDTNTNLPKKEYYVDQYLSRTQNSGNIQWLVEIYDLDGKYLLLEYQSAPMAFVLPTGEIVSDLPEKPTSYTFEGERWYDFPNIDGINGNETLASQNKDQQDYRKEFDEPKRNNNNQTIDNTLCALVKKL